MCGSGCHYSGCHYSEIQFSEFDMLKVSILMTFCSFSVYLSQVWDSNLHNYDYESRISSFLHEYNECHLSFIMLRVVEQNVIFLDVFMPSVVTLTHFFSFLPSIESNEIGTLMSRLFFECATWTKPMLIFAILDAIIVSNAIKLMSFWCVSFCSILWLLMPAFNLNLRN